MPPLALITPSQLKAVLEADDFRVIFEDKFFWYMAKELRAVPILLPKEPGEDGNVSMEIMESLLFEANIALDKYFALLHFAFGKGSTN